MNKEAAFIFEQSGCPSSRQLIDYLEGKLSPEQVHQVEAHLAGCVFCSEALDGFQQVEHKEQIPVIVKQIQGQLRRELEGHRSRRRRKKRYVWLSALIFIILIIILVAYFALYFVMKRERSDAARRQAPSAWVIPGDGARLRPGAGKA